MNTNFDIRALTQEPEMQTFPGGNFLVATFRKPIWDGKTYIQDITDPDTILLAEVGVTEEAPPPSRRGIPRTGRRTVYQYEGKLFIRATHRNVKDNEDASPHSWSEIAWDEYPPVYLKRIVLLPFSGAYTPFTP